jgi:meso-butanediol dehydrogenase/(S,S)-butanediol dehydrogenase/diacetyl reductase
VEFENKVALVTGAAGTIGKGLAERLCQQGASVFITDLDQAALDAITDELGDKCKSIAADCTKADQVAKVVEAAETAFGGSIDILVNVAGTVGKGGPVEDMSEETWNFVFDVNCKGTFLFTKFVVPVMKAGGGGKIVNFSSKSGKTGSALMTAYSAAKAAIIGLTQALAFELANFNINVNCVCPGGIFTKMAERALKQTIEGDDRSKGMTPREFWDKVVVPHSRSPLKRELVPEDIGHAVVFFASEEARNITGQSLTVDCGQVTY